MKVLMTTHPGFGHWHPLVPLAQALIAAGHELQVACSASFVPRVAAFGVPAMAMGLDWLESEPERAFPEVEEMSPEEREFFITEIFSDSAANQMTYDLLELFKSWQPDVVVRDYSEYGGCLAAELTGIPHAAVGIGIYFPNYISRLTLEKPLSYLLSAYGLPGRNAMEMLNRYLYLLLLPRSYQFPEYPLPPTAWTLKPIFPAQGGEAELPAWVKTLPPRPTIYASMGTVFNKAPEIFRNILEGLRDEPINLILTVGRNGDPASYGTQPDNVHIERFIPQAALMPYCHAVITHGGINTVIGAVEQGLPVVVIPLSAHQLQNTVRCRQLGLGLPLRPSWWDKETATDQPGGNSAALGLFSEETPELTPESIRTAVRALLNESSYRQAAQRLQAEMAAMPGPEFGVTLLERLARERTPLLA